MINYPDWCDTLAKEHVDRKVTQKYYNYSAYDVWRRGEFSGITINVHADGRRKTCYSDTVKGLNSKRVFMFGGSTMWGDGVPDCYTIPSLTARALNKVGKGKWEVHNLAEAGFVLCRN